MSVAPANSGGIRLERRSSRRCIPKRCGMGSLVAAGTRRARNIDPPDGRVPPIMPGGDLSEVSVPDGAPTL